MAGTGFLSRQQRFDVVGSTNDIVRGWLAEGTPEVCLALADEQSAGRGRQGRTWTAPPGRALLLSLGFRPAWLEPDRTWQLGAIVSLAMADAAEEAAGLAEHAIRLKWPNDMVVEDAIDPAEAFRALEAGLPAPELGPDSPGYRKLAGVLGETSGLGTADPTAIVGIGLNTDWPAAEFPAELAAGMTSLREASHGRPIDLIALFDGFLSRLEVRVEALRAGRFDVADWRARQLVVGREVRLERPDGTEEVALAVGVDTRTGALVVADASAPGGERMVLGGEIRHLRLARPPAGPDGGTASTSNPANPAGRV